MNKLDRSDTQEIAKPEWIVKLYYLDKFFSVLGAYQLYKQKVFRGGHNPELKYMWLTLLSEVCLLLWAKLAKRKTDFGTAFKLASNTKDITDEEALTAMKELAVFFEVVGYTKVEDELGPLSKVMVKER